MEFSTSDLTNFEYWGTINNPDIVSQYNVHHYIFMPICLYRRSPLWDNSGDLPCRLNEWLSARLSLTRLTIKNTLIFGPKNTKLILLFDVIFKDNPLLSQVVSQLHGINKMSIDIQFIDCRTTDEMSLSEMYAKIVSKSIHKYLETQSQQSNDIYLLSRLDNDDFLAPKHLQLLNILARMYAYKGLLKNQVLFDFANGLQYEYDSKMCYSTFWPENNFATIGFQANHLSSRDWIVPFSYPHDVVPDNLNKIDVSTHQPQWIQCIHNQNVANAIFPWSQQYHSESSLPGLLKSLYFSSSLA